jgi:hypothetical protein
MPRRGGSRARSRSGAYDRRVGSEALEEGEDEEVHRDDRPGEPGRSASAGVFVAYGYHFSSWGGNNSKPIRAATWRADERLDARRRPFPSRSRPRLSAPFELYLGRQERCIMRGSTEGPRSLYEPLRASAGRGDANAMPQQSARAVRRTGTRCAERSRDSGPSRGSRFFRGAPRLRSAPRPRILQGTGAGGRRDRGCRLRHLLLGPRGPHGRRRLDSWGHRSPHPRVRTGAQTDHLRRGGIQLHRGLPLAASTPSRLRAAGP